MNKQNNVFFLDAPVSETLEQLRPKNTDYKVSIMGDSIMVMIHEDNERRNIVVRPNSNSFTYEVNGHFFGTFFYDDDARVVVKWPVRLNEKERKAIIREVQHAFRSIP